VIASFKLPVVDERDKEWFRRMQHPRYRTADVENELSRNNNAHSNITLCWLAEMGEVAIVTNRPVCPVVALFGNFKYMTAAASSDSTPTYDSILMGDDATTPQIQHTIRVTSSPAQQQRINKYNRHNAQLRARNKLVRVGGVGRGDTSQSSHDSVAPGCISVRLSGM
jgi:hypothetical protein